MANDGYFGGSSPEFSALMGNAMFWRRLREIEQIADPAQRQQAMEQLARDFPGEIEDLQRQQDFAQKMAQTKVPMGAQLAGPASNPLSYSVAPGVLAQAAAGVKQYGGMKMQREMGDKIGATRKEQRGVREDMLAAGLRGGMAAPADAPPPGVSPAQWAAMTPEQKRKYRKTGLWAT